MTRIRIFTGVALLLVVGPRHVSAQDGRVYCVTSRDTSWRPVNFGFSTENSVTTRRGVRVHSYPIVHDVARGSPADSAGVLDGDELRAINGHDLVRQLDSARVKGPGVPTRFTIRRRDTTFQRTIVGLPAKPCPDSLRRRPGN